MWVAAREAWRAVEMGKHEARPAEMNLRAGLSHTVGCLPWECCQLSVLLLPAHHVVSAFQCKARSTCGRHLPCCIRDTF